MRGLMGPCGDMTDGAAILLRAVMNVPLCRTGSLWTLILLEGDPFFPVITTLNFNVQD